MEHSADDAEAICGSKQISLLKQASEKAIQGQHEQSRPDRRLPWVVQVESPGRQSGALEGASLTQPGLSGC